MQNLKISSFSLAKEKSLIGDDFYDILTIDNLTIAVVCDGVGGALAGAEAAKRVTKHLINNFKSRPQTWSIEKSLLRFIKSINTTLYTESINDYDSVELITTLCVVVIDGDRLYGANVGDSRVYLCRDNRLNQLSNDHCLEDKGYENVLTLAIGLTENIEPYYFENIIQKEDTILLCSDGLYNILDTDILSKNITNGAYWLVKKASSIMNDNLPDDTTAIVVDLLDIDPKAQLKQQNLIIPHLLKKESIIDGYTLIKPLIQNERTWLVTKSSKKYVMKFAPVEAIEDESILDLFVNEAWNAKRLKAGFFPKAVIPKNRTMRYYIMEYIKGITLKEHIDKKILNIEDSTHLAKTLLNMGQYLIKYDLVHGDIKPENIIITNRGDKHIFKVIDFGSIVDTYSLNSRAGTQSYLSPERFKGEAISECSEIFAIGATLYKSLSNKFPYGEIEPFQNPNFIHAKVPSKFNKNIPNWLDSIILRSISIDKVDRYNNYSQMLYELQNIDKIIPYFDKSKPFIQREPLKFYQYGFYIMLLFNLVLILN